MGKDRLAPWATFSLTLLIAINLFNYIDRQILAAVEPNIRDDLDRSLQAAGETLPGGTRWSMGLLSTAFLFSYMIFAPVFGALARRYRRWALVGVGVIIWSLASGASGHDWGLGPVAAYWALFATRCFVGIGEGGYGPVAPAMLSDLYPVEKRGRIMAYFYLAIPVGGALGYALGGQVVHHWGDWRPAFYLVVPPGILLGIACFFMKEPPRRQEEAPPPGGLIAAYGSLLRIPSYLMNTLGMTAMSFAIGGLAFWMPDLLVYRQAPALFGIEPKTAFGVITAVSGLFATISGGLLGDWLRKWHSGSYFIVSGVAMLAGAPLIVAFLFAPFPLAWLCVFGAVFCMFFNTGPTNTILANVTTSVMRPSGFALNILIIHLFGDAVSPPIMGALAEAFGDQKAGFYLVAAVTALGGLIWLAGAKFLGRDTERASGRESGGEKSDAITAHPNM